MTKIVHYHYAGQGDEERYVRGSIDHETAYDTHILLPLALIGSGWRSDELLGMGELIRNRTLLSISSYRIWELNPDLRVGKNGPDNMVEADLGSLSG